MTPKYVVETIGFNDGLPYEEWEGTDLDRAEEALHKLVLEQPRVDHRLIQVIKEVERQGR